MNTTDDMVFFLDIIRMHLMRHELPAPVEVDASAYDSQFAVFLGSTGLGELAAALLAWADTLDSVAARLRRSASDDSVIITVTGRLPSGQRTRVFGGTDYSPVVFPDLPTQQTQDLPLQMLRVWAWAEGVAA